MQLGKWEASIQDYEFLLRETPHNGEVSEALANARMQLKKQQS